MSQSRFQVVNFGPRLIEDGGVRIHARLRTMRPSGWNVVGVFQFTESEWDAFVACCGQAGIEVAAASEVGE